LFAALGHSSAARGLSSATIRSVSAAICAHVHMLGPQTPAQRPGSFTALSSSGATARRTLDNRPIDQGVGAKGFSSRRVPVRDDAYWKVREVRAGARLGEKTKGRYGGWE
jgi:hypothetical protein